MFKVMVILLHCTWYLFTTKWYKNYIQKSVKFSRSYSQICSGMFVIDHGLHKTGAWSLSTCAWSDRYSLASRSSLRILSSRSASVSFSDWISAVATRRLSDRDDYMNMHTHKHHHHFYSCSHNATTEPTAVTQHSTDTIEHKASIYNET